jgi:hypothetical protein
MVTRIALAALLVAESVSLGIAQSNSATPGTGALPAPPMKTAPASGQNSSNSSKVATPPAARSGEKGLRIGNDAVNGDLLEIKRMK